LKILRLFGVICDVSLTIFKHFAKTNMTPPQKAKEKEEKHAREKRKEIFKSLKIRKTGVHGRAASVFSLEFPFFI